MTIPERIRWVSGLALDASPLTLELAVRDEDPSPGVDPFVTLGASSRFSNVFLARLALPDGTELQRLAVKVQRHGWRPPTGALAGPAIDNREVDALFQRERENLLLAQGPGVVRCFDLLRGAPLPAQTFCQRCQTFFTPPSPQTGGPLEVCREDALLRDCGLEPFTGSTVRYLYTPAHTDGPRVFYTWAMDGGSGARPGTVVRRRAELYADLLAVESRADAGLCTCHAARGDTSVEPLVPWTYYPAPALLTEWLEIGFEDWCNRLGGAGLAPGSRAFFHQSTGGPELLAEVLYLKLQACRQVGIGLQRFHERTRRPHLGVSPDNLMVRVGGGGAVVPERWQFEAAFVDLGAAHRHNPPDAMVELLVPAADASTSYSSPFVDAAKFGQELAMLLSVEECEATPDGQTLRITAQAQGSRIAGPQPGDVVAIDAQATWPGLGEQTLAGAVETVQPGGATIRVRLPVGQEFDPSSLPFSCGGNVAFFRRFQAPCDLFGLGMVMLRVLLVHDGRDVFAVEDAVRRVLDKLELAVVGVEGPDRAYIVTTLDNLFDDVGFGLSSILYDAGQRAAAEGAGPDAALAKIWFDTLILAFRMLAEQAHFSFAQHHGDYDPERPGLLVGAVTTELDQLLRRAQVEFLGGAARGREIGEVCDSLLKEINAGLYGEGAAS